MGIKDLFNKKNVTADVAETHENSAAEIPAKAEAKPVGEAMTGESVSAKEVLTAEDVEALAPLYSNVVLALKQVYDPEIPVNIYDLGLIYELTINKDHDVFIEMTFTAPNCPMADEVLAEVKTNVEDVPGVRSCHIDLVFEPAWDQSMLSEEARVELGMD